MTDKFLGCILSIKTKPSPTIQNIIGTVRKIELNPTSQALILDDAMANGTVLNDGYVVMSHQIADLQVIGKASDFAEQKQKLQKKNINFVKNDLNYSPASSGGESSSDNSADNEEEGEDVTVVPQRNVTIPPPQLPPPQQQQHYKIAKPKPRKIPPPPPPSSSSDNNLLQEDFAKKIANLKVSEVLAKDKVGHKNFGTANLPVSSAPAPAPPIKLGALSCFLPPKPVTAAASIAAAAASAAAKSQQKSANNSRKHPSDRETFVEMDISEILTQEFDFEQSNAMFDKLPVQFLQQKPTTLSKNPGRDPKFTSNDTTHTSERFVTSTTVKNCEKSFLTDTGIAIPAVDLSTRSRILNLGNDVGLGHERMIESMARAVVQITLPLLGDGCRLSPERKDSERPWVLILAGPHWQGAVAIASARILSTLGVHTFIHSPKEELSVCAKEEKLYGLSGEGISRRLDEIPVKNYDTIIHALDDHLQVGGLSRDKYSKFLRGSQTIFVDPPLLKANSGEGYKKGENKVFVVTPILPLNYVVEAGVKFFVVNLGIPLGLYLREQVAYKSFYGDKLFVQVFGARK